MIHFLQKISKFVLFELQFLGALLFSISFLICLCDRSQCLESHGMVDFTYKLQSHYNIYSLIFPIWMENIIKVKIPIGFCKLYAKGNIP